MEYYLLDNYMKQQKYTIDKNLTYIVKFNNNKNIKINNVSYYNILSLKIDPLNDRIVLSNGSIGETISILIEFISDIVKINYNKIDNIIEIYT